MKKFFIIILMLSIALINHAQSNNFLRVFDISGKKIVKGQLSGTTETSLLLKRGDKTDEIPFERIGHILTKRSFGNNVLVSSLVIGGLITSIGLISFSHPSNPTPITTGGLTFNFNFTPPSNAEIIGTGLVLGALSGALVGGIINGTKKTEHFKVNGNLEDWKKVKLILDRKIASAATKN